MNVNPICKTFEKITVEKCLTVFGQKAVSGILILKIFEDIS